MASASYGSLPFGEQIAFFRRKLDVNTQAWTDVLEAEHDVAFMVAGANRDDLVADFRDAIRKAIEDGATLEDFRRDFDRIVEKHGWDYNGGRNWRSRVIYETNLRQSYNAGRWQQLQELKAVRPYWRYRHSDAVEHPRPIHQGWDGLILLADDPWWHTHFPANGWGCQCYVEALNERDLKRLGKAGPDTAPPVRMESVTIGARSPGGPRTVMVPEGVDPGFAYAPGRTPPGSTGQTLGPDREEADANLARTAQLALEKTARLPATLAADSAQAILQLQRVESSLLTAYGDWQAALVAADAAAAPAQVAGALTPALVRGMAEAGIDVATAAVVASDAGVTATLVASGIAAGELATVPAMLRSPLAVLLDKVQRLLVYVATGPSGETYAIAVRYQVAAADGAIAANALDGAAVADLASLRVQLAAGRLQLLQGEL